MVRRLSRWLGGAVVIVLLVVALWLLDHLRPRHARFETRHGSLESAEVTELEAPFPDVLATSVRARSGTGLEVEFRVLRPANIAEPVPLLVLLGGHRTGRRAVELVGDPGPVVVAALDYPYDGSDKIRGVLEAVNSVGRIQRALLDTPPAVSVALDWLIEQPWVDSGRVELVGVSLGSPFATVAGALDERFRRVWILHGGADNREWLANTLKRKIPSDPLRAVVARILHLLAHGASFDTETWVARISPRPVVIVGAKEDESLTRENVARLHAAAGEPKELLWTEGRHVHPKRHEIIRELLDIVLSRVQDESLTFSTAPASAEIAE